MREDVAEAVADGTWAWFGAFYEAVVVPDAVLFNWLTIYIQAALAIGFILGAFVRPLALIALVMDRGALLAASGLHAPRHTPTGGDVTASGLQALRHRSPAGPPPPPRRPGRTDRAPAVKPGLDPFFVWC